MAESIETSWGGPVARVNLYRPDEVAIPKGNLRAKVRFAKRATAAAVRHRPDVVLALHVNFLPIAWALGALARGDDWLFAIGVEVWSPLPWWMRRLIARCDRLLAISSFSRRWMALRAEIDPRRIHVVPLPVAQHIARAAESGDPAGRVRKHENPRLLTVSRLVPEHRFKGCFEVAEALPAVLAQRPNVRWVVVGDGSDAPVLRERCRSLGVAHAVRFTGQVDDDQLVTEYRNADVFVLPSHADPQAEPPIGEGFGLVFAEAGAFGVPSIGSREGGGSLEIVIDGKTGLTVPRNDTQALVSAILRLVENPALRRRLGCGARNLVLARHLQVQFAEALHRQADPNPRAPSSLTTSSAGHDHVTEPAEQGGRKPIGSCGD